MKRSRGADVPMAQLYGHVLMPRIGFGTWGGGDDPQLVANAVKTAIADNGFRSIDCAEVYKNEAPIGEALAELIASGVVARDELFVTSKVWNTNHATEHVHAACQRSLKHLQLKQLDLYLVHWPFAWQHIGPDLEWGPDKSRMREPPAPTHPARH
jgi:alcohol dehydrogenase (NADP+)